MGIRTRRILYVAGVVMAIVFSTVAMTSNVSAQTNPVGRLRFVHGIPGAPAANILVDKVLAASALEYANATRYLNVAPGDHTLEITPKGAAAPIFQGKVTVAANQAETVIAQGTADAVEIGVFEDNPGPVAAGNTRLTATNALKDAAAVDVVRSDGSPLVLGLKYGDPYDGFDIPAAAGGIAIIPAGGTVNDAIIKIDNLPLIAGTHNRLIALGTAKGAVKPSYVLLTAATDADDPTSAKFVSFVNASPDGPAVDVYVADKLVAPALSFGDVTPHIAFAGSLDVKLRTAGAAVDSPVLATLPSPSQSALTAVVVSAANGISVNAVADDLSTLDAKTARVNIINTTGTGTATAKLGSGTTLTSSAASASAKPVTVAAGTYDVTVSVDKPQLQLTNNMSLSGGVLYNLIVAGDAQNGKVIVSATGINEQPGSVQTGAAATEVAQAATPTLAQPTATLVLPTLEPTQQPTVAAQPTDQPTEVQPTAEQPTEVAQEPTATQEQVVPTEPPATKPPVPQGLIAVVQTNEGVNLKIREYPRTDARTLALVPSGSTLNITGVRGVIPPTGQPTPTAAAGAGPTATISAEGVTIDQIWLFVSWPTPDGGSVTGWINAQYVKISRNGRAVKDLVDIVNFKQIPANIPGEINSGAVTPVAGDANNVIGTVTVNEGTNLQLRRTPGITGESLALIPAGGTVIVLQKTEIKNQEPVVGAPDSTTWLWVRYETESGAVVGWINSQYVKLTRNQRPYDIADVPTATDIQRGFLEGNATAVKPPAPPGVIATADKLNQGANLQLRRDPNATAESLALIPAGTELQVLGRNGDGNWIKVKFEDKEGWINSQYVTVTKAGRSYKIADITNITTETDTVGIATPGPSPTPTAAAS